MDHCIKAWVYGKVQGVGYRLYCKKTAKTLSLSGYALNLPDGRVEVMVCGDESSVAKMVEALHEGPRFAHVLGVDVEPCEGQSPSGFMTG